MDLALQLAQFIFFGGFVKIGTGFAEVLDD